MEQQTISMKLKDIGEHYNEENELIPTKWDELIMDTTDAIMNSYKMPLSATTLTSADMIFCIIQFIDMSPEQKKEFIKQRSNIEIIDTGLSLAD